MFDEGRLTDGQGRTVDFTNTIIIMTSNIGSREILYAEDESEAKKEVLKLVAATLKPELINRIDSIIVFNRLREEQLKKIVSLQLNKLKQRLLEKNIDVEFDQSVIDAVMKSGLNTEYGARQIKRAIQTIVENPIAAYIVSDEITEGDKITFMIENGGAKYKKK